MRHWCAVLLALVVAAPRVAEGATEVRVGDRAVTLSEPVTSGNLTVYAVRGEDVIKGMKILTFEEAVKSKVLVVTEKGTGPQADSNGSGTQELVQSQNAGDGAEVNRLLIENKSPTVYVYIQSGQMVKGGKQDRVLQHDYLVPPKSGRLEIASFCVEQSRWSGRAGRSARQFEAGKMAFSREVLNAARKGEGGAQGKVWADVAKKQKDLAKNTNLPTQALRAQAGSSLQLATEVKKVSDEVAKRRGAIERVLAAENDAVGMVVVINGKPVMADVYGSRELFAKLRGRLVEAAATEALAELQKGKTFEAADAEDVAKFLHDLQSGTVKESKLPGGQRALLHRSKRGNLLKLKAPAAGEAKDLHMGFTLH
jgi:hypothetical protein